MRQSESLDGICIKRDTFQVLKKQKKLKQKKEATTGRKVIINLIIVCKSLLMLQLEDKSDLFFGICWKRKV